jgi:hypothetical protein
MNPEFIFGARALQIHLPLLMLPEENEPAFFRGRIQTQLPRDSVSLP